MRTVFKILLAPIWLLALLKLAFRLAAGIAAFVLMIGGGLLLVYDLFLLIIGNGSKELMLQLLTIGGLLIAIPLVAGFIVGLLEAAQEPIKEFIEQQLCCDLRVRVIPFVPVHLYSIPSVPLYSGQSIVRSSNCGASPTKASTLACTPSRTPFGSFSLFSFRALSIAPSG